MIYIDTYEQEIQVITYDTGDVIVTTVDPSASNTAIQFQDEGVNLGTTGTVNTVDFTGAGVTASRSGDKVTVSISAGGGGGSPAILVEGGAERKVSDMTALTAANAVGADLLPIVDVSDTTDAATGTNKKFTLSSFFPNTLPKGSTLNRFHTNSPVAGNTTTAVLSSTLIRAHPFYVPFHTTIDKIAIEITTGTSGLIRLGIYQDDGNGSPSALLVDGGELTVTAPAVLTSDISLTVSPGLYWLAYSTNTANTARAITGAQTYAVGFPSTIGNATMANAVQAYRSYAALPDPFTTPITYGNFSATPIIGVRFT